MASIDVPCPASGVILSLLRLTQVTLCKQDDLFALRVIANIPTKKFEKYILWVFSNVPAQMADNS